MTIHGPAANQLSVAPTVTHIVSNAPARDCLKKRACGDS